MTKLYLCEKPSQAKDIARVLGANQRHEGYFEGSDALVTWCFGHLLEMAAPDEYDPALKKWTMEALPIIPEHWLLNVRQDAKKQYNIIIRLFKQVDEIVVSTDADREGESIAREVMEKGRWQGKVTRLWLSALDDKSIRQALDQVWPGNKTVNLYHAASARSKADWLVGMTLSRLYTLSAQKSGHDGVMSVGRVQTPTLKLVVDRDRLIDNFQPQDYFVVIAIFKAKDGSLLTAHWQVPEDMQDEQSRCLSQSLAQVVADRCQGQLGQVTQVDTKRVKQAPPLLYSLSDLQQEASRLYGLGAQAVLDGAQSLYETHKLTTYPRTDCQYLPHSQHQDAATIIDALKTVAGFDVLAENADINTVSKAWNDQKITAHHAIIPTGIKPKKQLTETEQQLFKLICLRYLAQFYPVHEYDHTKMVIGVNEDKVEASGKQVVVKGWKAVLQVNNDDELSVLPGWMEGVTVTVDSTEVKAKKTQPPLRYTEGTLIQAMKTIGKFVENPILKQRLKDTSGIGTEATRASIIEVLIKRKFITKQGRNNLVSTVQAKALIDVLPVPVKDPATTAVWEQALDDIAQGQGDAAQFVADQAKMVSVLTERVKQKEPEGFKVLAADTPRHPCPICEHYLVRRKSKNGFFWGCQNYPECQITLPDNRGKPGKAAKHAEATGKTCPECDSGELIVRTINKGNKKGKTFLGCNRYPHCSHTEG